jgi:hypothetical protein
MGDVNAMVMRRSVILWAGAGLLMGFNIFVASRASERLVMWALGLNAAFALFGIAFGIWAARKVAAQS